MKTLVAAIVTVVMAMGAVLAVLAVMAACFAFPVKWLWNYLMPGLFHLREITFWQALALNLLCGLLFRTKLNNEKKSEDD